MNSVRKNFGFNIAGGLSIAALHFFLIPIQISFLGFEAYAVVSLLISLQLLLTVFDFGLSNTITKQVAEDISLRKESSRDLLASVQTLFWIISSVCAISFIAFGKTIASGWFNDSSISIATLTFSVQITGIYLAIRWPIAFYTGVISGYQRLDVLNVLKVSTTLLRLCVGIWVVYFYRSLESFFVWNAVAALIELLAYAVTSLKIDPNLPIKPKLQFKPLKKILGFSLALNALSVTAVIIVQADKIIISKTLSLELLGYYSLAYTVASSVNHITLASSAAVFPWLAARFSKDVNYSKKKDHVSFFDSTKVLVFLSCGLTMIIWFYGPLLIEFWINQQASNQATDVLRVLAVGFLLSAILSNLYNAAIASGYPEWHLKVNLALILPYLIMLYLSSITLGIIGVAYSWLILNSAYAVFITRPIINRIFGVSVLAWVSECLLPSLFAAFAVFALPISVLKLLVVGNISPGMQVGILLGCTTLYLILGYIGAKLSWIGIREYR